ncbi:hypothetical protein EVA_10686 [gut metagenome]|uniref:Uncharacterized protein n=1 Tax=gut metagenome TaxID=749906 RepID=J9G1W6_9ZZZZ
MTFSYSILLLGDYFVFWGKITENNGPIDYFMEIIYHFQTYLSKTDHSSFHIYHFFHIAPLTYGHKKRDTAVSQPC